MKENQITQNFMCLALVFATVSASVVPSLLESVDYSTVSVLEVEHDPNLCGSGHDHSICLQYSTGKALVSEAVYRLSYSGFENIDLDLVTSRPTFSLSLIGHNDRAPPIA
ncbi:MAG TPA: hypothetical protein EYQ69_02960 [Gemmatimonadetes bacterium]|nr:hypothetical protein [Gemmatimonadota bacterium]